MSTLGQFIDTAIEKSRVALVARYGPDPIFEEGVSEPLIVSDSYAYGSTAGPFGRIGGQMITGFRHVTVVFEREYVFIYAGRDKGVAGRMTEPFYKALFSGANPWTHAHLLRKETP